MSKIPTLNNKFLGYILLLLSAFCFAIFVESSRGLAKELDWQATVFARSLSGILFAFPLAWFSLSKLHFLNRNLVIVNFLVCAFTFGILYGASIVSPADAIAITSTLPIWVAIVTIFIYSTKYVPQFWFASSLVVVGISLLVTAHPTDAFFVILVLIAATICRAFSIVRLKTVEAIPTTAITLHFTIMLAGISGLVFWLTGDPVDYPSLLTKKNIALLFLIGFSANMYITLLVKVAQILGPVAGGVVGLVAAVFAFGLDVLFWNDHVTLWHLVGLLLVIVPVGWIVFSKHVKKEPAHIA